MKATKANKKWNLVVQKSPEPKIVSLKPLIFKLIIKIIYMFILEYIRTEAS